MTKLRKLYSSHWDTAHSNSNEDQRTCEQSKLRRKHLRCDWPNEERTKQQSENATNEQNAGMTQATKTSSSVAQADKTENKKWQDRNSSQHKQTGSSLNNDLQGAGFNTKGNQRNKDQNRHEQSQLRGKPDTPFSRHSHSNETRATRSTHSQANRITWRQGGQDKKNITTNNAETHKSTRDYSTSKTAP